MTDPMDKWGNGATTNADLDRPWITKKLDLYAKWRAKLTGAQGIGVIYDANGGTKPPHDKSLYLDQAEATAQAASIAPSGEVFKYWVVQTWDEDAQKYRDTNITVLPGDNFTVLRDNARRQENPDHTPEKPSYTYTVCLRAEYTTSEEHTPTHIHFYGNIQDKDGNPIAGVTAAPDGNEPKDVTTYDGNIQINEAVDILTIGQVLGQQSNLYSGFKFLGWAKERDATEPWLKLNEDGTTYTVTQGGKTYSSVTQIAADERLPYDDFYAVWERKTYTVSVEKITEDAYKNELFGFSSTFDPALDQSVETSFTLVGNTDGATVDDVTYGHTKEFIEVPYGTKFTVTENDSDAANYNTVVTYDCTGADDASKNVTDCQVSTTRQSGELTVDGNMVVKFTNTRKTEPVVFKKVDQTNQATILPNAEFTMVGPEDEAYTLVSTSGTFKAKEDGTEVSELSYGVYTIAETKPPAGYNLMTGTVTVTIAEDGVSYQQSDNGGGVPTAAQREGEDGPYVVVITNNPGVKLPMTGGPGTNLFTITGTALIVGALMYGSVSRRRNERRSMG